MIQEIKGPFFISPIRWMPCGLAFVERLWWRFVPGTVINVSWPRGDVVVDYNDPRWFDLGGAVWVNLGFSADPNDHYRPYLEKHVGRQGWDWNWGMADRDATDNRLTIKIRRKHAKYATLIAMMWS